MVRLPFELKRHFAFPLSLTLKRRLMHPNNTSFRLKKITLATLMTAAALVACSKKEIEAPKADTQSQQESSQELGKAAGDLLKQISPDTEKAPAVNANASALPTADGDKALTDYQPVNSGVQLAYLYYALSGLPVDYEKLAGIASQDYRSTTDSFKKADILAALKPQIDQQINSFRTNRYVKVHMSGAAIGIGHYDLAAKSFPVNGLPLAENGFLTFNDSAQYHLAVTNGSGFNKLKIEDQAKAKEMESLVTKGLPNYYGVGQYPTPADLYLFAQGVDQNSGIVKFQIVEVSLADQHDNLLGVIK
jgi:hypothetical protein